MNEFEQIDPLQDVLNEYVNYHDNLDELLDLFLNSLSAIQQYTSIAHFVTDMVRKDHDLSEVHGPSPYGDTERLQQLSDRARREQKREYSFLYAHFTLLAWNALEDVVDRLALSWLRSDIRSPKSNSVNNVKVSIARFELMSQDERLTYILEQIKRDDKLVKGSGIEKFEGIFRAIGLGGTVEPHIKDKIKELLEVRNAIMHRRGQADEKLVSRCPHLGLEIGDQIIISESMYQEYVDAVAIYVGAIKQRATVSGRSNTNPA